MIPKRNVLRYLWNFYTSPHGRIGRGQYILLAFIGGYLLYMIIFTTMIAVGMGIDFMLSAILGTEEIIATMVFMYASFIVCLILYGITTIKRLHDLGRPGSHIVLFLAPLYQVYMWFLVLVAKGDSGENQYGSDPYDYTGTIYEANQS